MNQLARFSLIASFMLVVSCVSSRGHIKAGNTPGRKWKTIDLKKGITYNEAWRELVGFADAWWSIETADKNDGYLRTFWGFSSNRLDEVAAPVVYKNRLNARFINNKTQLQVWVESFHYYHDEGFPTDFGVDDKYTNNIYSAIVGKLGQPSPSVIVKEKAG